MDKKDSEANFRDLQDKTGKEHYAEYQFPYFKRNIYYF